jgi:hypothetical protein
MRPSRFIRAAIVWGALSCTARNPAYQVPPAVAELDGGDETSNRPGPEDAAVPARADAGVAADLARAADTALPDVMVALAPDAAPDLPPDQRVHGPVLLVVGETVLSKSDAQLRASLQHLGFMALPIDGQVATAADATDMDLVVISGSAWSDDVGGKFRDVPVPVVVFDASIFDDMKMTGTRNETDFGTVDGDKRVAIVQPQHPLAAGLSGTVTVSVDNIQVSWGVPASSATRVASLVGQSNRFTIFGYLAGSMMSGLVAPARRVGSFVRYPNATTYTAAGLALFEASVLWAVGER